MTDQPITKAEHLSPSPGQSVAIPARRSDLAPASKAEGTAQLASCLVLVAPSGMTANEREQWLKVARQTLSGIPADLLAEGCAIARRKCRFPSEIVPMIFETMEGRWASRRQLEAESRRSTLRLVAPEPAPEYVDPAEVRKLIARIG